MPFGFGEADLPDLPNIDAELNRYMDLIDQYDTDIAAQRERLEMQNTNFLGDLERVIGQFGKEAAKDFDFGNNLRDVYRNEGLPLARDFIKDASKYDTRARREQEAARASSEVRNVADAQDEAARQDLARAGIDPDDPRFAAARASDDAQQAAFSAEAANEGRLRVEDRGREFQRQAIGVGTEIAQTGARYSSEGLRAAGQIPGFRAAGINSTANLFGTPEGLRSNQLSTIQQLLDTKTNRYSQKIGRQDARNAAGAGLGNTIGTLAGAGIGFFGTGGNPAGAVAGAQIGNSAFGG